MLARVLAFLLLLLGLFIWLVGRAAPGEEGQARPAVRELAQQATEREGALSMPAPEERRTDAERVEVEPELPPLAGGWIVRVTDEQGLPRGGVPVALLADIVELPGARPLVRATTREGDGAAALSFPRDPQGSLSDVELSIGLDLPLEPPVAVPWSGPRPAPGDPPVAIDLTLPSGALAWLEPVRVRVVDADAAPVIGAQVVLRCRRPSDGEVFSSLGSATSEAPEGIALIERTKQRESIAQMRALGLDFEYEVAFVGPHWPEPATTIPSRPSSAEVVLQRPPSGAVEVRLTRADGRPDEEPASVSLTWYEPGWGRRLGTRRLENAGGVARFEGIGLGLDLLVGCVRDGGRSPSASSKLAGPKLEGEAVLVELSLPESYPTLAGRLVDERGQALAEHDFGFGFADRREPSPEGERAAHIWRSSHRTDAQGRFRLPFSGDLARPRQYLRLWSVPHAQLGKPKGWIPRFVEHDFPLPAVEEGVIELGELEMAAMPVIAAGIVVDEAGEPVSQAWLSIRHPVGAGDDRAWHNLAIPGSSRVASALDGRFELRSLEPVPSLRLSASLRRKGQSRQVEVPVGARDVRLVLEAPEPDPGPSGMLRGSIRVDEGVSMLELSVELHGEGKRDDTMPFGKRFRFRGVQPGTYRLEVRSMRTSWLVAKVEGLVVEHGRLTREAAFDPLDLRGLTRRLRLDLVLPDGSPHAQAQVNVLVDGQGGDLETNRSGRLDALIRSEDTHFLLQVHGHQDVLVTWSPEPQTIHLSER